ncbi:FG-GAP repeat protein [Streptomyces longwoodensis]|uniref:FG-GAP repeat protein n=1 Tax=Streptomyces longwoodensis TaxID=68231 RepID=UPI003407A96B
MNDRPRRGAPRAAAVLLAALLGGALLPAAPAAAVHDAAPGDFNGDGYRDAVLSAPGANVAGKEGAGAVVVLYGAKAGLSPTRRAVITQNSAGVPDAAEASDAFGSSTATADLDRDGYADLVVGTPYEDTALGTDAGSVTVLWGGPNGLAGGTDLPTPETDPAFYGLDVTVRTVGTGTRIGVSGWHGTVLFDGPFARTGRYGSVHLDQNTPWPLGVALGDFDGNGTTDPAVVTGGQSGLSGGEVYTTTGYRKALNGNGLVIASGDVNGDGYTDLVAGDPWDPEQDGVDGAVGGRVLVWRGSAAGITPDTVPEQLTQNTAGVPETSEKGDAFGAALTVADLNRDGLADIVIGAPSETLGGQVYAGQVTVVPGRRTGALGTGSYLFSQDSANVPDASETDDQFGTTVAVGDVDRDGRPELFVGGFGENDYTGAAWVFPGATSGPTTTRSRVFTAAALGLTQQDSTMLGGTGLSFWA